MFHTPLRPIVFQIKRGCRRQFIKHDNQQTGCPFPAHAVPCKYVTAPSKQNLNWGQNGSMLDL